MITHCAYYRENILCSVHASRRRSSSIASTQSRSVRSSRSGFPSRGDHPPATGTTPMVREFVQAAWSSCSGLRSVKSRQCLASGGRFFRSHLFSASVRDSWHRVSSRARRDRSSADSSVASNSAFSRSPRSSASLRATLVTFIPKSVIFRGGPRQSPGG